MKVVVYTVILGGYDKLRNHVDLPYDFIAFVDDKSIVPADTNWEIRDIPTWAMHMCTFDNFLKLSNVLKFYPHKLFPEYDISIYEDGKISINKNIQYLLELDYEDNRILTNKHPLRQCLYNEIDVLRKIHWERNNVCDAVERLFNEEDYPKNMGMIDTCMIIRHHNDPYVID